MRCRACNRLLSDYESSLRSDVTKEYIDLCRHCLNTVASSVKSSGNAELLEVADEESVPLDEQDFEDWNDD